ncbi:MAG: nucleotidyltransferase domain-containing protein [Candidatus Cloacimonetes bacterium]|nr:nucleotidyltransferase domain-containing protein [Candidatus Cloacimonadota bacterium]
MYLPYDKLDTAIVQAPYPLLFATISGAHLYGFPSKDSDFDLRGAHILKRDEIIGLYDLKDTIDFTNMDLGIELDLVTHDITKFFSMLLKRNGYVLEQLYSPLIVHTSDEHDELKEIAKGCVTRHHYHHYSGFYKSQLKKLLKDEQPKVKPLLYAFRVLFTGLHLMRTGTIEANILNLNQDHKLPYIDDLVQQKVNGDEKGYLESDQFDFFLNELTRFHEMLLKEGEASTLREEPNCKIQINDLLLRLRNSYGV